ncbi:MAG: hypothetical protein SWO11_18875 [Thermodesulfobacteriota bacterium]|nr:hypothetical protein [Thermodesulfobacteriota bacterium]
MEITIENNKNVTPIMIKDASDNNAKRIGTCVIEFAKKNPDRNIEIQSYRLVDDKLIILVTGNIGNAMDHFLIMLSGIEFEDQYHYEKLQQTMERVRVLSETEYNDCVSKAKEHFEFTELNDQLLSIYS